MLKAAFAFAQIAGRDALAAPRQLEPAEHHLREAEAWLCRAQDASTDGGVSYGYSLRGGWRPSYPETSGYIATTFFRLARERDPSYLERAQRILRWLVSIQNADGSFCNPRYGRDGIVFDTGQVLFGLVRGYEVSGDPALLASGAACRRLADAHRRCRPALDPQRAPRHAARLQHAHGLGAAAPERRSSSMPAARRSRAATSTGRSPNRRRAASSSTAPSAAACTRSRTRSPTPRADSSNRGFCSADPRYRQAAERCAACDASA